MRFYTFGDIRQNITCTEFVTGVLGYPLQGDRCQARWRNGDGWNVALNCDKWYDHARKDGGDVIKLCALAMFDGDIQSSQEYLGDLRHLTPKYDPSTLHADLSLAPIDEWAKKRGWNPDVLRRVGAKEDTEKREVLLPMLSHLRRVVGWRRRKSSNTRFGSSAKTLSEKGGKSGLFYDSATPFADTLKPIILCEGEADWLAVLNAGYKWCVGTPGASVSKPCIEYMVNLLRERKVALCPDPDEAGLTWRDTVARSLMEQGCEVRVIAASGDLDMDKRLAAGEKIMDMLKGAQPWTDMALEKPAGDMNGESMTDTGNAQRFFRVLGRDYRYCVMWTKWLVWNDICWHPDDVLHAEKAVDEVIHDIRREAYNVEDADQKAALHKWASSTESISRRMGCLGVVRSYLAVKPDDLDQKRWLITLRNKTFDLQTQKAQEHSRTNMVTKYADADYVPGAECPNWEKFIGKITNGKTDIAEFIQRAVGYSMTGVCDERCMFILYGKGRNGKSTFVETIASIMHDYATRTPTEILFEKKSESVPNDKAALKGARFVYSAESDEGKRLSEAAVKDMTGTDTIAARFMRGEWFSFVPEFKLWFSTNHKPQIRGTDDAIWDRIRLIPFTYRFTDDELIAPSEVEAMFKEDRSGILNWMLKGLAMWREDGLKPPQEVMLATQDYRGEMDIAGAFIDECCIQSESCSVDVSALYDAYHAWCEKSGERPLTKNKFGSRMRDKGFEQGRSTRSRMWEGIGLKASEINMKDEGF